MNWPTLYHKLVRFGAAEFKKLECVYCKGESMHLANYVSKYSTDLHQIFKIGRHMGADD